MAKLWECMQLGGGGGGFAERKKETLNLKLNTKSLKFKCGLADGGGGGWLTHARHGYPHLVYNKKKNCNQNQINKPVWLSACNLPLVESRNPAVVASSGLSSLLRTCVGDPSRLPT